MFDEYYFTNLLDLYKSRHLSNNGIAIHTETHFRSKFNHVDLENRDTSTCQLPYHHAHSSMLIHDNNTLYLYSTCQKQSQEVLYNNKYICKGKQTRNLKVVFVRKVVF